MKPTALLLLGLLASCSSPSRLLATIPADVEVSVPPSFAPNGNGVAYAARGKEGDWVVRDSWRSRTFEFICCLSITEDGKHVSFIGNDGPKALVHVDDKVRPADEARDAGYPLTLSRDASVIAVPMYRKLSGHGCVSVNGADGPEFDRVGHPAMSRDGQVVAYRVERGGRRWVRCGDQDGPAYAFVTDPVVSADGSAVAYGAELEGQAFVIAGERKLRVDRLPSSVFVSDDGGRVGWIQSESKSKGGTLQRVVLEGSAGRAYGLVGAPVISPSRALVAYAAEDGDRKLVVIGTKEFDTPDRISDVSFSSDGRRVGYGARIGRELWWNGIDVPAQD